MKKLYPLFILLTLFLSSCKDLNDKRLDAVKERIAKYSTQENITVLSTDFKSLAIPFHNHAVIEAVSKNARQLEVYKKNISAYKQKNFAEQDRVWIKDMTEQQITSYEKLMDEYDKLRGYFEHDLREYYSYSYRDHYNRDKEKNTSFWIKYKEENSDSIKYGVFYFDSKKQTVITRHIIFDEQTYKFTTKLMDISKAQVGAGYLVPSVNLDVVPEDEDPSKTKEERKAIKEKERQEAEARERAEMMRKYSILRTVYGVSLGEPIQTVINRLKNQGHKLGIIKGGVYIFYMNNHFIEDNNWNFVRFIPYKGRLAAFVLEENLSYRGYYINDDVKRHYESIVSFYRDKYNLWFKPFCLDKYEDDKTILKIGHDHCSVFATYVLKELMQ